MVHVRPPEVTRTKSRSIEVGRMRIVATEQAAGGWYVAITDGRSHAAITLRADDFAYLFTPGAAGCVMERGG